MLNTSLCGVGTTPFEGHKSPARMLAREIFLLPINLLIIIKNPMESVIHSIIYGTMNIIWCGGYRNDIVLA